jgi:hypothetical protein
MDHSRNDTEKSWDGNLAIRYCTPDKDTHSFAVVREDGSAFNFDSAANEKAAALPLSLGKHFVYFVKVASGKVGNAFKVQRISLVARVPRNGPGAPGLWSPTVPFAADQFSSGLRRAVADPGQAGSMAASCGGRTKSR